VILGEKVTVRASLALGAVACAVLAALVFRFDGFMGPDSGARFMMIKTWEQGGSPFFLPGHPLSEAVNDPLVGYQAHVSRGTCTLYPPLFPLLAGLLYFALGRVGLVVLPAIGGLVAAWATYRSAKTWALAQARWMPAVLLLASPLLLYSSTFWDHSLQIAVVALSTWFLLRAFENPDGRWALAAGAVMGGGVWLHELQLAAGLCFAVALWPHPRLLRPWALGFAGPLVAWIIFNLVLYGAPMGPHVMGPLDPAGALSKIFEMRLLRDRVTWQLSGGKGVLDWAFTAAVLFVPVAAIWNLRRPMLLVIALVSALAAWLVFDQVVAFGLFEVMPWALFAFAGKAKRSDDWRDQAHQMLRETAAIFIVGTLVMPILPGLNWGSRYLLTMLPVLALLAMRSFEDLKLRPLAARAATTLYALFGLVLLGRAAWVYRGKVDYDRAHAETIAHVGTAVTATDVWWLAPELSTHTFSTRLFLTAFVPATEQLPPRERTDPDAVVRTAFFDMLQREGTNEFTFVGTKPAADVMRAHGGTWRFVQVDSHQEADMFVVRFAR
jgi:hypothetical protein